MGKEKKMAKYVTTEEMNECVHCLLLCAKREYVEDKGVYACPRCGWIDMMIFAPYIPEGMTNWKYDGYYN